MTQLLEVIGRSRHVDEFRHYVDGLLVDFQYIKNNRLQASGGFRSDPKIDASDDDTTTTAAELMQYYGVPNDVNLVALRSYLRPTMLDRSQLSRSNLHGAVQKAVRQATGEPARCPACHVLGLSSIRDESLDGDDARAAALLCCYATMSAPGRTLQSRT